MAGMNGTQSSPIDKYGIDSIQFFPFFSSHAFSLFISGVDSDPTKLF